MRRVGAVLMVIFVVLAGVPAPALAAGNAQPGQATETMTTEATANGTNTTSSHTATVTVLSYNDIQTAAAQDEDFPRLVQLIHNRRTALGSDRTVVVGGGDEVGPHALSPVSQWRVATDVLNVVDPAADVIGNHEFDYGYDAISDVQNDSEFPWLAANIVDNETGEPFQNTEDYVIVERNGVRIGVVGLIDEEATYGKTNIDFAAKGVTVGNYTKVGPEVARTLKQEKGVDVVVALTHIGVNDSKRLARADDGNIDVIVTGDDEVYYPPKTTSGTIISEGEARAEYLGELNLTVNTTANDVTAWNGRLINVTASGVKKNQTASRIINGYRANVSLDATVAYTDVPLDATFATNYHRESRYGNLITDAMRNETGADVAITNAGGIRSNRVYGPGNITGGDVFNTLPFPNTLVTVELTGVELEATLESQVVTVDSPTGQQFGSEISQQVSGISFEWNEATGEVTDLRVNGEPVRANKTYTVTVNSFMAAGGSGYPLENATRVSTTDKLLAEVVIDYMEAKGTVAPEIEGRMVRYTTDLGDQTVQTNDKGVTVVRYDRPENASAIDTESFYATNGTARVEARKVIVDDDVLVVQFDSEALAALAADGSTHLNLYGNYNDSRFTDRVYWETAVLAGDLQVVDPSAGHDNADDRGN